MINYYFDNTHPLHPLVHSLEANPDSMAPDNALRIKPKFKDGFFPCEKSGKWAQVTDLRGQIAYEKQSALKVEVKELGELPEELTLLKPATEFDYWNGQGWQTDNEKQQNAEIEQNELEKQARLEYAEKQLAILQRAIKLEMATEDEKRLAEQWEIYTVLVSRIDVNHVNVTFPEQPM